MISIQFVDKVSDDIEEKMRKGFIDYETSHGIDVNYKKLSILLLDETKTVLGVLNAFTAFAEVYIDDIWVDENYRGQGHGRMLIEALENNFKGKGFNNINLVTSQFQSPKFYKKCGFEIEFIRKNTKNPKLTKFFMIKFFNEENQTQGILKYGPFNLETHH